MLAPRMEFLVPMLIFLHLNIDLCSGDRGERFLIKTKGKNTTADQNEFLPVVKNHEDVEDKGGNDYQNNNNMGTDGDGNSEGSFSCKKCIVGAQRGRYLCRLCHSGDDEPFSCRQTCQQHIFNMF